MFLSCRFSNLLSQISRKKLYIQKCCNPPTSQPPSTLPFIFPREYLITTTCRKQTPRPWPLLSIYSAPLNLVSQRCRVGHRGNHFSVIIVITPGPYHHGCLSYKSCISTVLVRTRIVLSLMKMEMNQTNSGSEVQ